MSQDPQPLSASGLDLLRRLVASQLASEQCEACGGSLGDSPLRVREQGLQHVVIEVRCRLCDERLLLRVEPEATDGAAGVR